MINISRLYCGLASRSDSLRYSGSKSFGPVVVYNCTQRCNLRCAHCYSASTQSCDNRELDTREAKNLLYQLAEVNCPVVLFSGGEALLREDLFELLAEAKRLGLRAVISTNGTLIDETSAEKLSKAEVGYVGVSLDGQKEFHDDFRGHKGAFAEAMKGIETCQKAGLKTGLRFTMTKANISQIAEVFDIAAKANARRICFYHLIRMGRAKELEGQVPTIEQSRAALDTIIDKTRELTEKGLLDEVLTVGNYADGPFLLLRMQRENSRLYDEAGRLLVAAGGNRIGEKICAVGPEGSVYADQFWRNFSLGNVREKSFKQILQGNGEPLFERLRNRARFAADRCKECKWFELCRGNMRFLGADSSPENWVNEPACFLSDEEIK